MRRCVTCILPDTFPDITFDATGVCSVCTDFRDRAAYIPSQTKLQRRFDELVAKTKTADPSYDALVALSGGKDSTYLTYLLTTRYNLRVLTFTLDNGFIPQCTFDNMRRVVERLGVDHIILKPRHDLMKKLYSVSAAGGLYPLSLLKCGSSICISCIRMVNNLALRTAIEKRIPMVMLGNSPGQLIQSENEIFFQDNRIPYAFKYRLFRPLADAVGEEILPYVLLDKDDYSVSPFPYTISPFPIIGYDEEVIYRTIEGLGWKRPPDVDACSTNCRLNSLGIVNHQEQLGFHPYDYELSMLVRLGTISRDEALRRTRDSFAGAAKIAAEVARCLT